MYANKQQNFCKYFSAGEDLLLGVLLGKAKFPLGSSVPWKASVMRSLGSCVHLAASVCLFP